MTEENTSLKIKDLIWSKYMDCYKNKFLPEEIYLRGSDKHFVESYINQKGCCIKCKQKFNIEVRDIIKLVLTSDGEIICRRCTEYGNLENIENYLYKMKESDDAMSIIDYRTNKKTKWIVKT